MCLMQIYFLHTITVRMTHEFVENIIKSGGEAIDLGTCADDPNYMVFLDTNNKIHLVVECERWRPDSYWVCLPDQPQKVDECFNHARVAELRDAPRWANNVARVRKDGVELMCHEPYYRLADETTSS